MDLLIKGLEIPKEGSEVLVLWADGHVGIVEERPRRFECVAIPEHGRLIDADKFVEEARKEYADCWNNGPTGSWMGWHDAAIRAENAPTIIEASERKEQ